jgi:hypothetical protein
MRYQAVQAYGSGYAAGRAITGSSRQRYRMYGVAELVDRRRDGNRAPLSPSEIAPIQNTVNKLDTLAEHFEDHLTHHTFPCVLLA